MSVNEILTEMDQFTPEQGWNLVGLDDFEPFGEKLYLIGHFETREEAEAVKATREASQTDPNSIYDPMFIYGPKSEESLP
jgi:hypothetical protein